ncbi:MAG: 16S rRNA (cytosine(967)-C(5))-methyltransferase RsmB [Thermodesulfobacteriota bacterium]|nr:16S rRNA (cytosine(967)-C(5))-methyltransferase RsmB [Thermodesulfobacteriota bacterium]
MENNPRTIAVNILNRIDKTGSFAEPILDSYLSRNIFNNIQDRRLLTQLVYGTLRMRGHLDWIIQHLYSGRLKSLDTGIKNILRTGLYQLMFTDRIPEFATVDEAVKITKKKYPGRSGLVNAILRNAIRKKGELEYPDIDKAPSLHISIIYSHPLWIVERWLKIFGVEETLEICKANNENPPLTLRVNRLKTDRDELLKVLSNDGFTVRPAEFSPYGTILSNPHVSVRETKYYKMGQVQIQDEASQLISRLVNPKPGEKIMDICAGVGGKTTHMAEMMQNTGNILALDISHKKIGSLKEMSERLGVTIIDTLTGDATSEPEKTLHGKFDRVLVDAPCSGLGTLRRNPEIKWRMLPEDLKSFPPLQKRILNNARHYLKRGGTLIYSTCTIMPEENEDVVASFLSDNPGFERIHPNATINDKMVDNDGFFRTYPHRHGTDSFFGAVLVKK